MQNDDCGLLLFDFRGQGKSLDAEISEQGSFLGRPTVLEQSKIIEYLVDHFEIPKFDLLFGLSYGGGIAIRYASLNRSMVDKLLLMAPFTIRLDQSHQIQRTWHAQLELVKSFNPVFRLGLETADSAYDRYLYSYMNQRFSGEIPDPIRRDAAIQLSFGIMRFNVFHCLKSLPDSSVHLIVAGQDTLVPQRLFDELWEKLQPNIRESYLLLEDAHHIVPMTSSRFIGKWAQELLSGNERIKGGQTFRGESDHLHAKDAFGSEFKFG